MITFTCIKFYIFLPLVYFVFYFSVDRLRWFVLLIASYVFYASINAPYLVAVLLLVTGISYVCGLLISYYKDEASRKNCFQIGVIACIAILVILKYLPFIRAQSNSIFSLGRPFSETIISIGASYFIFQSISYLADIYLEIEVPERHFGYYALYLAFFPKLLQGPIERASDLIPQLKKTYQLDFDVLRSGMLLFTWGLFKKVVVADRFAPYADQVYNDVYNYTGFSLIIGTYAYAFQILFDFSAYTDMARGVARLFGINLTENFNSPYLSTSIADFWRRWHISFSRWIQDYIFKPLQMRYRNLGTAGTAFALLITFLISGVWHGATWGFVLWGVLHGIYLAVATYYKPYKTRLHKWLGIEKSQLLKWWQIIINFNLVSFAWIFFRSNSTEEAVYVIKNIGIFNIDHKSGWSEYLKTQILIGKNEYELLLLISVIVVTIVVFFKKNVPFFEKPIWIRWPLVYALVLAVIFLGNYKQSSFIYFKF